MSREVRTVKTLTTYYEIEALCEGMIADFFRRKQYTGMLCVDIEAFVREYLGLRIVYESLAEPDPGRVGFFSDGVRPLRVRRGERKEQVVFPARTVVIDRYLLTPGESARKRFTIAHEGAHDILERHVPLQTSPAAAFHSAYDPDMTYTRDMLRGMLSVNESYTNRAAACLLMPAFLVEQVLERHNGSRKVIIYDGGVLAQDQKLLIQKMADTMGVSYTAFSVRLSELDLYESRPLEEYLYGGLRYGGERHAEDH